MTARRKRNANGVVRRQIGLRLPAAELQHHEAICSKHDLTNSALAYSAYKAGLPLVMKSLKSASSLADPQGAVSSPSGTSFYSSAVKTV